MQQKSSLHAAAGFGLRLKHLRESWDLSVSKFATLLGYHRSYVHRLETESAFNPSADFIAKTVARFDANPSWLLRGEGGDGAMYLSKQSKTVAQATIASFGLEAAIELRLTQATDDELMRAMAWFMGKSFQQGLEGKICAELGHVIYEEIKRRATSAAAGSLREKER